MFANPSKRIPTYRTLRADLKRVGIALVTDGRSLDFHCLRLTHATMLAVARVSVRESMAQMRHTNCRLTTEVYTDPRLIDLSAAVNKLPRITATGDDREQESATGTDGAIQAPPRNSP